MDIKKLIEAFRKNATRTSRGRIIKFFCMFPNAVYRLSDADFEFLRQNDFIADGFSINGEVK
jgi:hypothetical protein